MAHPLACPSQHFHSPADGWETDPLASFGLKLELDLAQHVLGVAIDEDPLKSLEVDPRHLQVGWTKIEAVFDGATSPHFRKRA